MKIHVLFFFNGVMFCHMHLIDCNARTDFS